MCEHSDYYYVEEGMVCKNCKKLIVHGTEEYWELRFKSIFIPSKVPDGS